MTPWADDHLVPRPLPVHKYRKTHTQHKHQTSMSEEGFEPTITASERAKTVHALEHSAREWPAFFVSGGVNSDKIVIVQMKTFRNAASNYGLHR
jgi:hypothetical protein